jgi:hypothetical protein
MRRYSSRLAGWLAALYGSGGCRLLLEREEGDEQCCPLNAAATMRAVAIAWAVFAERGIDVPNRVVRTRHPDRAAGGAAGIAAARTRSQCPWLIEAPGMLSFALTCAETAQLVVEQILRDYPLGDRATLAVP